MPCSNKNVRRREPSPFVDRKRQILRFALRRVAVDVMDGQKAGLTPWHLPRKSGDSISNGHRENRYTVPAIPQSILIHPQSPPTQHRFVRIWWLIRAMAKDRNDAPKCNDQTQHKKKYTDSKIDTVYRPFVYWLLRISSALTVEAPRYALYDECRTQTQQHGGDQPRASDPLPG